MDMIHSTSIKDPLRNIGYKTGIVLGTNREAVTATVLTGGDVLTLPVVYNCPAGYSSADAFAVGDDAVIRLYKGEPSHVVGFTRGSWPCVRTPALVFEAEEPYTYDTEAFIQHPAKFYDRYKPLTEYGCEVSHTHYINRSDAVTNEAFTTIETDWYDGAWNRYTEFYYGAELIYTTHNNETAAHVFNGTRSNVFGRYINPRTGWACMIYQINTFTDWKPRTSGRVDFDYYLYTSTGINMPIASAYAEVNSASAQTYGLVISEASCAILLDSYAGNIMKADITLCSGGMFTSDGSINTAEADEEMKHNICIITEGVEEPLTEIYGINTEAMPSENYRIYVKRR